MSDQAYANPWALPLDAARGAGWRNTLGAVLGTAFTLGLFLGIAHFQQRPPAPPAEELEDLHVTFLPVQPPPVPVTPTDPIPEFTPMAGFELSHSESAVKIAVSPPDLAALLPEDLSKAPPANVQFSVRSDFKPRMSFMDDTQHIFQRSELDEPLTILDRPDPQVSGRVRNDAQQLRVTLVAVIEATGEATHIKLTKSSGNKEFDAIILESFKEWVFSPPTKAGKKVRCLIEQGITVKWDAGSKFRL